MIYGYNNNKERKKLLNVSVLTLLVFCIGLLIFAWEGVICLIMAMPIGLFFTWLGHGVGYKLINNRIADTLYITIFLFLSVPALMAFEYSQPVNNELRSVTTSIEIAASPKEVWKNVIAFPQRACKNG